MSGKLRLSLEREDLDDGSITYHLWDGDGHWIVGLNDDAHSQGSTASTYAKAIVTAVNAHETLVESLRDLLDRYTELVNCGDCGNWDPEKEPEVVAARAALATASAGK